MLFPAAKIELVYQDETGSRAALTVSVPASSSVATAVSAGSALAAVVAPLTGAVLVNLRISYQMWPETSTPAEDGSSIVRRGVWYFAPLSSGPYELIEVPGIREELFITIEPDTGLIVDSTLAQVIAFNDAITTGIATNVFGDDLDAFIVAYRQSRV